MALSAEQIRERLRDQPRKTEIAEAIRHEDRIRFHAECFMSEAFIQSPTADFLAFVNGLLPKDKFDIFSKLLRFPLETNGLCEKMFTDLEKVYDGKDPSETFQFSDPNLEIDWAKYRAEVLHDKEFWKAQSFWHMKYGINSILVVDAKPDPIDRTDPYYYFLNIRNVLDYHLCRKGSMTHLIFKLGDDQLAVFDDVSYRIFEYKDNKLGDLVSDVPHGLGYCPATFFWTTPINSRQRSIKKSPLTPELSNLDWYLFFSTSKRHLDLYAPYPIYSSYEADCDFKNNETGEYCDGGFLRGENGSFKMNPYDPHSPMRCPICAEKRIVGVGSMVEVPVPEAGGPDLRDPISITTIDRSSLDYNVDETKRLADTIHKKVVGYDNTTPEKTTSMNEMQISSGYDSRRNVLTRLKDNLEAAHKFALDTCCLMRYRESYRGSFLSMGTEFYLYTVAELQEQYRKAKENGASQAELDTIDRRIDEASNRTNNSQKARTLLLRQLEPYRLLSISEVFSYREALDPIQVTIKMNFNDYITRFERENGGSLLDFGTTLPMQERINLILNTLKLYANERIAG